MNQQYDPRFPAISDLRCRAKRRMPGFAFDFLEGGAGRENAVRRNEEAFDSIVLKPRYGVAVEAPDLSMELFGKRYAMPIGIAPVGLGNLLWPGAEQSLARAARRANIPYILSTAATTALEEIAPLAGDVGWFQLYVPADQDMTDHLIGRVKDAGFQVLVVTMDVPVGSKRDRDLRNGLRLPLKYRPRLVGDAMTHPAWALGTLRRGLPVLENFRPYAEKSGQNFRDLPQFANSILAQGVTWERLQHIRSKWQNPLVLKGILTPEDFRKAQEIGVDGVIVSNHGGRQLDGAPATLHALSAIRQKADVSTTLMLDGGIRSGADVVAARAAGAAFTFSARNFYYAVAALGDKGGGHVLAVLADEMTRCVQQLGCPRVADIDERWLWQ